MSQAATLAGAAPAGAVPWHAINWRKAHRTVRRLQARIVKAAQEGRWGRVKALQRLLTHSFSGKALAVRRVTENQGKRTPGVDGATWDTPAKKARAAGELLNVDVGTIAEWCRAGRLDARQEAPHHPRWITLTPERIAALRKPVRQRKPRRASPPTSGRPAAAV